MELEVIKIENPNELNFILGHSHFIKTVEDIHEALVNTVPNINFGLAFCEASQKCLVRRAHIYYFFKKCVSHQCTAHCEAGAGSLPYFLCHCQSPGGDCG